MAKTVKAPLKINAERLYGSLADLGKLGAYKDETTGLIGVNRLALTAADGEGRRLVTKRLREAGLQVTVDQIGNVYGRRQGREDGLAPLILGSHIDSVPTAGAFDGCLGVLGALEVIRALDDLRFVTRRPIMVAFFTDEEGCRFGTDMLGSATATGRLSLETAYALKDRDGLTVKGELEKLGFLGCEPVGALRPHAYLECHIEQGPLLRGKGLDVGIVTGVQAISWHELTLTGKSAHAGTTPMSFRRDAGLAAARLNCALREMALSGPYGKEMRAAMGAVSLTPNMVNVVPGRALCTVDLRNPSDELMAKAEKDFARLCEKIASQDGVTITSRRTAKTPHVPFDASVQALLASTADGLGLSHEPILSGAGHDAQEWSRVCKTAMVFVPGEYDGISHNPREFSTSRQCSDGVNVLLGAALVLAEEA
ncbi:MAG TPA: Zn-dependent hydrolase [Elusimicrobia bacterium]|nr:MAG: Zn-dependent hydrolase [Elusimicrobia bacterium GWA2_66_18]OGR72372.1 MAG: Zn-dependent hydrolase [Elusimicrobia bacterium GWC2_65_9]HAZ08884.1 Zn-dependent hydrolase [Elusimicrobiota bacterium]